MPRIPFLKSREAIPEEIPEENVEEAEEIEAAFEAADEAAPNPELTSLDMLMIALTTFREARVQREKTSFRLQQVEHGLGSKLATQSDRELYRLERRELEQNLGVADGQLEQLREVAEELASELWDDAISELREESDTLQRDFNAAIVDQICNAGRAWPGLRRRSSDLQERSRQLVSLAGDLDNLEAPFVGMLPTSKYRPSEMLQDLLYRLKNGGIEPDEPWDDNA